MIGKRIILYEKWGMRNEKWEVRMEKEEEERNKF